TIRTDHRGTAAIDEHSLNGTWIDDRQLVPDRAKNLRRNEAIQVGGFELYVSLGVPVVESTSVEQIEAHARSIAFAFLIPERALPYCISEANSESVPLDIEAASGALQRAGYALSQPHGPHGRVRLRGGPGGAKVNGKPVLSRWMQDADVLECEETVLTLIDPLQGQLQQNTELKEERLEPPTFSFTALEPSGSQVEPAPKTASSSVEVGPGRVQADAKPTAAPTRKRPTSQADLFLVVLAAVVFILSSIGLFVLLGNG
ncbi:MAG: hypothetical protein AAF550_07595, partial [Myxococcota bacterium]